MHVTASPTRPAIVKLLVGAVLMLGLLSLFVILAGEASAGGDATVTVNSTGNFTDGDCEGPPNDDAAGNCTLAEAINVVNAGDADIINFHPPVFSKESPGVIDIEGGDGCLPPINLDLIIDSTDTGVIIDGDAADDGSPVGCDGGLEVNPLGNGHDFALNGGKNFEIREIRGDGILLDGDGFSFGDVDINGVIILDVTRHGIEVMDAINLDDASFTNNDIAADYPPFFSGQDSINIRVDSGLDPLSDNTVNITDNIQLLGSDESVDLEWDGDLEGTLTVNVSDNDTITALDEDAVEIDYSHDGHDAGGSEIIFWVNNNEKIHGGTDAIDIHIQADRTDGDGDGGTVVDVQINENGRIDGADDSGVDARIEICCANSDSVSSLTVDGNEDIVGDGDGVHLDVDVCCGDGNDSTISVSGNDSIEGQSSADDDDGNGVYIEVDVGDTGDERSPGTGDSDDNTSLVQVNDNGNIDGGGDGAAGVRVDFEVGSFSEDADDNSSVVEVIGNGPIDGDEEGVDIFGNVGSDSGDSADDNSSLITVSDNASIDGDEDEGVEIAADVGGFGGPPDQDGDDDSSTVVIENNGPIEGGDDAGIDIELFTGGDIPGSEGNSNTVMINGNEEITGQSDSDGDGIDAEIIVCCDSANTNMVTISGNGDIHGLDGDGIDLFMCCSVNVVTITDNTGTIRGNDGHGIRYSMSTGDPCPDCDSSLETSVNMLTIMGNDLDNSEDDGINICCGAFELASAGLKSVISDNQIHHNIDDGIEIDCAFGLNIVNNEIFSNGNDVSDDAGIEISNPACSAADVPGNANRISENSIHDNIGLGIDLIGDEGVNGVGCTPLPVPYSPNDCISEPDLETQAGDKLIGTACSLCLVEVFWADNTPDDNDDHGEGAEFIISGEADDDGNFSIDLPCDLEGGDLTATATDKLKNTSEFSENLVTLGTGTCATDTPVPTDTPDATDTPVPPTATPVPPKVCGDPNMDSAVNAVDATLILQFKADMISSLANESSADVNDDGGITSVDAALILQVSAGLISEGALSCPA